MTSPGTLRVFSFGGGVQSTAALVLAAQGRIHYRRFVFAHVGDDSENPETLRYLEEHALPFAAASGLDLHILREGRAGRTLLEHTMGALRSVDIPMRPANGRPGNRACTGDFKIKPIARWLKREGASAANPATVGIGISVDEFHRARKDSGIAWERLEYPLITLRLDREACRQVIARAGLPIPAKSSCWFCPFKRPAEWRALRKTRPDLFAKAAELEQELSGRSVRIGRVPVFLTRFAKPLEEAIAESGQLELFADDDQTCDSGYCWR
jgi:hypothetical protein